MNVSVALKLTIARFINSSLVLIIVNSESRSWYKAGDLVYDATLLICILAIQGPLIEILYIPGIIKWCIKRREKAKGKACTLTQREANILCEGHTLDVANNISNFMNMIMTCCFYSPLIPQAIPIAFVSSILCYWTTKYSMLRRYKMPDMFSDLMATFFSNMMPWLVLAWAFSAIYFLGQINDERREAGLIEVINDDSNIFLDIAAAVSITCVVFPWRSLIKKRIN